MALRKGKQKPMTFRFSEDAQRLLRELAQKQGISMTSVLELLIRKDAKDKDIK